MNTFRILVAFAAAVVMASTTQAETIIKFNLGDSDADFVLSGGVLGTLDGGDATTSGDQNTDVNFTGFLDGMADISLDTGSFSLSSVMLSGPATTIAGVAIQATTGGMFSLYDDADALLLSGTISDGAITGSVGSAATGSFLNLSLDAFTGGSLLPLLDPNSLGLAISFTDVNGGSGFSVLNDSLMDFQADGTGNISAAVPEPAGWSMIAIGLIGIVMRSRRV